MESLGANRAKKLMQELWCKDDAATESIRGCGKAEGARVPHSALPLASSVSAGKIGNCPKSQFPHL